MTDTSNKDKLTYNDLSVLDSVYCYQLVNWDLSVRNDSHTRQYLYIEWTIVKLEPNLIYWVHVEYKDQSWEYKSTETYSPIELRMIRKFENNFNPYF